MMNWSEEVEKLFETALLVFPEDYPDRWERIAEVIPGATKEMVCQRYHELQLEVDNRADLPATDSWPSSSSLSCSNHVPVNQRYEDKLLYNASQIELGQVPPPDYRDPWPSSSSLSCGNHVTVLNHRHQDQPPKYSGPIRNRGTSTTTSTWWSLREHILFLVGVEICGKGKWKRISHRVVKTKTASQIGSHAQKFYLRQSERATKAKTRPSIHDWTLADVEPQYLNDILSSLHHQVHSSDDLHQAHYGDRLPVMNPQPPSADLISSQYLNQIVSSEPSQPHHQSNSSMPHHHHQVPSSHHQVHHRHDVPTMNRQSPATTNQVGYSVQIPPSGHQLQRPWPLMHHQQSYQPANSSSQVHYQSPLFS